MNKQTTRQALSVRIPAEIKEWLEGRAVENGRSLNSELVQILKAQKQAKAA